jgi:hypothetical protein
MARVEVENEPHLVEIVAALKEITVRTAAATSMTEALHDVTKVLAGILPPYVQCGVAMVSEGEPATFASAGAPADLLDEARCGDEGGPGIEAIRSRNIVLAQDLACESRWPAWTKLAREFGVASVLAYPFDVDTLNLGALTLYGDVSGAFGGELPIIAMLVADHASLLMRVRLRQLGSGVTIERATGIVMAQRGGTPEQARQHLEEAAAHLGVDLATVAERLVTRVAER